MPFSIRLTGIKPEDLDISELTDILMNYKRALLSKLVHKKSEINVDKILVSLIDIGENSVEAILVSNYPEVEECSKELVNSINSNKFDELPDESKKSLITIIDKAKVRGYKIELYPDATNKKVVAQLEYTLKDKLAGPQHILKGRTTIYGRVITVGGVEPRAQLRLLNGRLFRVKLKEETAKALAVRLYQVVALKGIASWRSDNMEMVNFEVEEILPYQETDFSEVIKKIHSLDPDAWKGIKSTFDAIKEIRDG